MNNSSMAMMPGNPHSMKDNPDKHMEHVAFEKLMTAKKPTHIAIKSGSWSDPRTWKNGRVPGDNAKVLIEKGTTVTYDQISDARIDTIANRGNLRFVTGKDTKLVVETLLNGAEGKLDIGSKSRSVAANKRAQIIFTSDRAINTKLDPTQLGKGLISHGEVNIYGADKLDKAALVGDAAAGNNTLTFKQNLAGWQVGDKLVVGGTGYKSNGKDSDNSRLQDEVLTITAINGKKVSFTNDDIKGGNNDVLRFDHTRSTLTNPKDLTLYAANITRNVSFETENGKKVPINRRAHVMLMHNPKVNVLNAGFYELGRSDKSKMVDDIGKNMDGSKGNGTNIRGRYMLHLHKTGVDNPNGQASILRGNALVGGPGWGIVQHESHAGLEDNVVFDVRGAGIVAESGNELGWWTDNMVIKSTGIDFRTASKQRDTRKKKFDLGFDGDGYWIQGAGLIKNKNNKAISSNRAGMVLFGSTLNQDYARPIKTIPVKNLPKELRGLFAKGQTEVDIRDIPFSTVKGFESYNGSLGVRVWAHGTNFDGEGDFSSKPIGYKTDSPEPDTAHTGRSRIEDFKAWGNRYSGAEVFYSSNIDLKNGLILGREGDNVAGGHGVFNNHASFNSTFDNMTVAGYRQGAEFEFPNSDEEFNASTLKNSKFLKNTYNLGAYGDEAPVVDSNKVRPDEIASYLKFSNNKFFDQAKSNKAPVAKISTKSLGGLAVELNGSGSYDSDPLLPKDGKPRKLSNKGITGYAWDLNGDGRYDRYGQTLKHVFDKAGSRKVSLTVMDAQGEKTTTQQTVNVRPTAYSNAFVDGNFNKGTPTQEGYKAYSQWADGGWFLSKNAQMNGGSVKLSKQGDWSEFVGRVLKDDKVRKGQQTLGFRLKNIEGAPDKQYWEKNEIAVKLWGVNGPFYNSPYDQTGPEKIGTLPMNRTQLLSQDFGGQNGEFFDWKKFSFDVNLGKGYDHLLFQVNTKATRSRGDNVSLDDVSLTGRANAISGGSSSGGNSPTRPTPGSGSSEAGQGQQLVAQLSFEESISQLAKDSSTEGQNNAGRFIGKPRAIQGKVGQAVALDGGNGMIALGNSKDINQGIHGQRTIALAFKVDDASVDKKQVIYEEGGQARGLNIYVEDNLLHFSGWNNPESQWSGSVIETKQVKSDKWHHVALVLDGQSTVTEDAMTAYLDGQNIGQAKGSQLWSHSDPVALGNVSGTTRFADGTVGRTGQNGLAGAVDEFQVYNSVLSGAQVKQLSSEFV